jgi:hypothetical protein
MTDHDVLDGQLKDLAAHYRSAMSAGTVPQRRRAHRHRVLRVAAAATGVTALVAAAAVAGVFALPRHEAPVEKTATAVTQPTEPPERAGAVTINAKETAPVRDFRVPRIVFARDKALYMSGLTCESGTCTFALRVSRDAGTTWHDLTIGSAQPGHDNAPGEAAFTDAEHGLLSLHNRLFATSNAGRTWTSVTNRVLTDFNVVGTRVYAREMGAQDTGVAGPTVGPSGAVWVDGTTIHELLPPPGGLAGFAATPDGVYALSNASSANLVAFSTTDGGKTWTPATAPCTTPQGKAGRDGSRVPVWSIKADSNGRGLWFSCDRILYRSAYLGAAWVDVTGPLAARADENTPDILPNSPTVVSYDGSTAWASVFTMPAASKADVDLFRTTDGGATWVHVDRKMRELTALDAQTAFALAEGDLDMTGNANCGTYIDTQPASCTKPVVLYRTSDGGATWSDVAIP